MSKIKFGLAALFVLMGGAALTARPVQAAGDCIYAEYRGTNGACFGATTRLCSGPPDCKQQES